MSATAPLATPTKNLFAETSMSAKIVKYSIEKDVKGKEYVAYHLECKLKDLFWTLKKRYSECRAFHTRLTSTLVTKDKKIEFPPKLLTGNFNASKIENRLNLIQQWFDKITNADSVWYANYEALIHEFLQTDENLARIIAHRCKVDEPKAREKLSQVTNYLSGLPDYNKVIEALLEEKTQEVMKLSGEDHAKARKALCEHGNQVEAGVHYLLEIKKIMENVKADRSIAVTLYYKHGSADRAVEAWKKDIHTPQNTEDIEQPSLLVNEETDVTTDATLDETEAVKQADTTEQETTDKADE